ncbi:MAG: PilZ domain-containing protein [Deltaproteobacteria bacterium]|nr:PilZ domain-containing protein [Deltaproteobacteria bacterium]
MATLLDRRLPRVEFRAPIWMSQPPEDEDVPGQALNLSERGLFIGTDRFFEIGSTLRLRLALGTGQIDVGGRVAWTRPLPSAGAPAGVGVEFTDLDSHGLERIKAAIGSDREHAIRVRFAGLPAPIRARASVSGDALSLHTELPFLRLGSLATFSLEGDADSHRGRIHRVSIEPGGSSNVPRLRIEVDVLGIGVSAHHPEDEVELLDREQPIAAIDEPAPSRPAIVVPEAAPQWIEPTVEESTEKIVKRPLLAPLAVTAAAAILGFTGTFAVLGYDGKSVPAPTISFPEPASAADPTPAFAAEPPAHPVTAAPAQTRGLGIRTSGESTIVELTLAQGTTDGLTHYLLADPTGIAVNLPGGTVEAEHKVHWTETGHAKKIWIRDTESGDQVRIFFPDASNRSYRVVNDGVHVTVTISR